MSIISSNLKPNDVSYRMRVLAATYQRRNIPIIQINEDDVKLASFKNAEYDGNNEPNIAIEGIDILAIPTIPPPKLNSPKQLEELRELHQMMQKLDEPFPEHGSEISEFLLHPIHIKGMKPIEQLYLDPINSEYRPIETGRILAEAVHRSSICQFYYNAALILESVNCPKNEGNPFKEWEGILAGACVLARKHADYHKWNLHRRLRPVSASKLLGSNKIEITSLYPEPESPSYPSSHATIAGAAITILKSYFDCNEKNEEMNICEELNKLAENVGAGRCWAGVNYRTDCDMGYILGEEVAINYLRDKLVEFNRPEIEIKIKKMDGSVYTILPAI